MAAIRSAAIFRTPPSRASSGPACTCQAIASPTQGQTICGGRLSAKVEGGRGLALRPIAVNCGLPEEGRLAVTFGRVRLPPICQKGVANFFSCGRGSMPARRDAGEQR